MEFYYKIYDMIRKNVINLVQTDKIKQASEILKYIILIILIYRAKDLQKQKIKMELLAYRSLYITISSNQHFIKSVSFLSKISQIIYPDKSTNARQRKPKCWLCASYFQHSLMLILHLEVVHVGVVQKYEVRNQALTIISKQNDKHDIPKSNSSGVGFGQFFVGIVKSNKNSNRYNSYGAQFSNGINFVDNEPAFLKKKLQDRCKLLATNIFLKIERPVNKRQQVYLHSTNIFKRVVADDIEEDSEDQLGEVQKQLQKLRIEDFSDVNDNDKKFFVEWNGFIHQSKKKLGGVILAHDMPNLFVQFSGIVEKKGIPRINLVMHAWTLWSVGQINSTDLLRGLNEYDDSSQIDKTKENKNSQQINEGLIQLRKIVRSNNNQMQIQ